MALHLWPTHDWQESRSRWQTTTGISKAVDIVANYRGSSRLGHEGQLFIVLISSDVRCQVTNPSSN